MERKRASSSKSSEKRISSKQNEKEIPLRSRSKTRKNYKRISYCEDSSSEESVNAKWSQIENSDKSLKEEPSSPYFPNSSDLCDSESSNHSDAGAIPDHKRLKNALNFGIIPDLLKSGSSNRSDASAIADDKSLRKAPSSPLNFPNTSHFSESGSSPFLNWCPDFKRHELHKKDGRKDMYDDSSRNTPEEMTTGTMDETWKKFQDRCIQKKQIKESKELKRSKLDNAKKLGKKVPSVCTNNNIANLKFSPVTEKRAPKRPSGHSEVYKKHEKPDTAKVDNVSRQNKPAMSKGMKKARVALKNEVQNRREIKRSKINNGEEADIKYHDGSNENIADLKFSPVTEKKRVPKRSSGHSEVYKKHETPGTVKVDNVSGRNKPEMSKDSKKARVALKKDVQNTREIKRPKIDVGKEAEIKRDIGSNNNTANLKLSPVTGKKEEISRIRLLHSKIKKRKKPIIVKLQSVSGQNKPTGINKGMSSKDSEKTSTAVKNEAQNTKEIKRPKINDGLEAEIKHDGSNEVIADLKFSPVTDKNGVPKRPSGHSEPEMPGKAKVDNGSGQIELVGVNKGMSSKDSEKTSTAVKNEAQNMKEIRPKINVGEEASKKHDGSDENIADMRFSSVTAVGAGVSKRRSDPTNALKEIRPRTSM